MSSIRSEKKSRRAQSSHQINRIKRSAPLIAAAGAALWSAHAALAVNYTWIHIVGGNASGSWGDPANWKDGAGVTPTSGALVNTTVNQADRVRLDFLDLTADSTITLDGPRYMGGFTIDDANFTTPGNWILNATSASPSDATNILTFANAGSNAFDTITV